MRVLNSEETSNAKRFMQIAWEEARRSKCKKSNFGAVIVKDNKVLAKGYNRPVDTEECEECIRESLHGGIRPELCYAVHAEQNALLDALKNRADITGAVMYIGHIKNNEIKKFSGRPYCTICSRLVAASGLKGVIFFADDDSFVFLTSKEFNDESFRTVLGRF